MTIRIKTPILSHKIKRGFSLVEVMIALGIFGFLATVMIQVAFRSRAIAEANVYDNTALTVSLGYAEQIKNMNYLEVYASHEDNGVSLATVSVNELILGNFDDLEDPITVGSENDKQVLMDIKNVGEENESRIYMPYRLTISTNALDSGANPIDGIQVTLDYEYDIPTGKMIRTKTGSVRFLKVQSK